MTDVHHGRARWWLVAGFTTACSHAAQRPPESDHGAVTTDARDAQIDLDAESGLDAMGIDGDTDGDARVYDPNDDPMTLHKETRPDLLALIDVKPLTDAEFRLVRPDIFLAFNVGPVVTRMNQGNKSIAHHARSKNACLAALAGVTIQTDEQRDRCGAPNMIPIYRHGDPKNAAYCIDAFEFPNKPCELPFVWAAPTHAQTMCTIQGKRLCTQEEWSLACRADPSGGPDTPYAYGSELDLDICNTNKPRGAQNKCMPTSAEKTWETCSTDTEPTGSFPKCKSRFGVYDQHGNVAEIMTRHDKEGTVVSQLKGSAFFYAEVARKANEPQGPGPETYPDTCNYDPRWHVEPISGAWHVNYHLGFRCCKSIAPQTQ